MIPYTILKAVQTPPTKQTVEWVHEHSDGFIIQYDHDYIMWPSPETHLFVISYLADEEVTVAGIVSIMINGRKFKFCICLGEDNMTLDDIDAYLSYHNPQIQLLADTLDKEAEKAKEDTNNV